MDDELNYAEEERRYFETIITNNDNKLAFLDLVKMSLNDTAADWAERDRIDEQIQGIYDQQVAFQSQKDEISTHISNLNFERFQQDQAWQVEDEANFMADATRAEEQKADYVAELGELDLWLTDFNTLLAAVQTGASQ
jgi:hypothetical protein